MRLNREMFRVRLASLAAIALAATLCPSAASADEKDAEHKELHLTGVTISVPSTWTHQKAERPGPMAPKAIFTIPALEGDSDTGMVRITYFPGMKGKNRMNIDRWLGQVTQVDGKASTRENAKITKKTIGAVELTIVDLSGAVRMTMRSKPKLDSRMIAAIIDHPKGPHFVVIAGNVKLMNKWEKDLYKFLETAKVASTG